MRSLLEQPVTRPSRRRLPSSLVDWLLLVLQCLFCLVFASIGTCIAMSGSPRYALPLLALAIAANPLLKLPPFVWLGLIALGLALA